MMITIRWFAIAFVMAFVSIWLLCGTVSAANYGLVQPKLAVVDDAHMQAEVRAVRASFGGTRPLVSKFQAPVSRGRVSLVPMFSSQQGSWPFEPFVKDGLFRAMAGYQAHHPQAVMISGGSVTLEQLAEGLQDAKIMRRHKDGYLVSYPLIIAPDAALLVRNQALYLYTYSGTAIINQGLFSLEKSKLESWNGDKPQSTDRPFRPFVVTWAGSRLQIENSSLVRLGYNANLARGISSAYGSGQGGAVAPAQILVRNSQLDSLSTGLELQAALAQVEGNQFKNMQQYALDLTDGHANVRGNAIEGVHNNSGIRVRGRFSGQLAKNRIFRTEKAGIEINDFRGQLAVSENIFGQSQGNAIQVRDVSMDANTRLLLDANIIGNSQRTAIEAVGLGKAYFLNNQIGGSPEYAISVRNPARLNGRLVITGNYIAGIGKALVRVEGVNQVVLGANQYRGNPLQQNLLIGDLLPVQSQVLESTVRHGCYVNVNMTVSVSQSYDALRCAAAQGG